ncbi:MAG: hypothetical protein E7509_02300 [Ruminococcus sp.]|nr:hypothetical protein [Ruminococcus sp.]
MLSFDISDRQINIVKGVNLGGKIRIDRSCMVEVPAEMIVNGEIINLSGVAELITNTLKAEMMMDREAIVSFSSSSIVFKELIIPRAKGEQFLTMVQNQMVHEMGITDEYSISYTVVGDAGEESPGALKVLATACPSTIVESYRKSFNIMGIALKSVNICCNSITRIVLADQSNLAKMPLLVVQINKDFLGLTLFENGQMAFARYTPISEEDYDSSNYIIEALNENIFRMTQFNKARGGPGVSNVIVYGEIGDYITLADSLLQMDVQASILPVPSTITGFENFEFTDFANAIGALYKRNRDTERINLLEVDSQTGRSKAGLNSFLMTAGIIVAASLLIIIAITWLIGMKANSIQDDINETQSLIDECRDKAEEYSKYNDILIKLTDYKTRVETAEAALNTKPIITQANFKNIDKYFGKHEAKYKSISYNIAGTITINEIIMKNQEDPRALVETLINCGKYVDVSYSGWQESQTQQAVVEGSNGDKLEVEVEGEKEIRISSMTLTLKPGEETEESDND